MLPGSSHTYAWPEEGFSHPSSGQPTQPHPEGLCLQLRHGQKAESHVVSPEGCLCCWRLQDGPQGTRKRNRPFSFSAGRQLAGAPHLCGGGLGSPQEGWDWNTDQDHAGQAFWRCWPHAFLGKAPGERSPIIALGVGVGWKAGLFLKHRVAAVVCLGVITS